MTMIVCPFVTLGSVERRETYLPLLREIAEETQANEPECFAYCWMRQAPDSIDPSSSDFYVRGLEVYANEDALAITHRSKDQYKHMRATVAAHPIITFPVEGLKQRTPAGVGFLSEGDSLVTLDEKTFVSLSEYLTQSEEAISYLMSELETLSEELKKHAGVLSFWAFKPKDPTDTGTVEVFGRYESQGAYEVVADKVKHVESMFTGKYGSVKTGFWQGAGFGFIRGGSV